jgi:hypothetical protein
MKTSIHTICITAIALSCLLACGPVAHAGDFVYSSGGLRGGDYSARVTLSGTSDSESGNVTATYPNEVDRVAIRPYANVEGSEHPGYGLCEFYHAGWASDTPSAFFPPFIFEPHGSAEFGMSAHIHAATSLKPNSDNLDFAVDSPGILSPAYVESTTSDDGFAQDGPLTYELLENFAFDQEYGDYIRVQIYLKLTTEATINNVSQGSDYFDLLSSMYGEAVGAGDNSDFIILRNDEVVWESGVDGDIDPTANIAIDARFGDTIGIMGGVAARMYADGIHLDHGPPENNMWTASVDASLHGNMNFADIPGSKASKFIAPPNMFSGAPFHFDPIDLSDNFDELGVDDPLWFATPNQDLDTDEHIPGYLVEIIGAVPTGVELPDIGDGFFDVYVFDHDIDEWVLYELDWSRDNLLLLPDGTEKFKVMGYEEVPHFDSPFFLMSPVGITFESHSNPSVMITPLPEPTALILLTVGLPMLLRRRGGL